MENEKLYLSRNENTIGQNVWDRTKAELSESEATKCMYQKNKPKSSRRGNNKEQIHRDDFTGNFYQMLN